MPFINSGSNVPMARSELIKVAKRLRATGQDRTADQISSIINAHLDLTPQSVAVGHAAIVRKISAIRDDLSEKPAAQNQKKSA